MDTIGFGQGSYVSEFQSIRLSTDSEKSPRDHLLADLMQKACTSLGIPSAGMTPIQRMFATHYRCPKCKMLPLYQLDLTYSRRARCGQCGHHVALKNAGKYGKVRKQIAFMLK